MKPFFQVKTPAEVLEILRDFPSVSKEEVGMSSALGRVTAEPITSPENLPPFHRATVDGYAVLAKDTFGASDGVPVYLEMIGEIFMGEEARDPISAGRAIKIATGGMLPPAADAVVMEEYTNLPDNRTLEVTRACAPWDGVLRTGEDVRLGDMILEPGRLVRPQEIGALSALGIVRLGVYRKPMVSLIATGDELVNPEQVPAPGQIRNLNQYSIGAMIEECGGIVDHRGIIRDDYETIHGVVTDCLERSDLVLISGGSSIGRKDFTVEIIESLGKPGVLVHGISISPGKPTIVARIGNKPVIGLPGHPVSAMIVFEVFMKPLIRRLAGLPTQSEHGGKKLRARLSRNVASAQGREDYIRVALEKSNGGWAAQPVLGKSSMISTMIRADGYIRIDLNSEGFREGQEVEVTLF